MIAFFYARKSPFLDTTLLSILQVIQRLLVLSGVPWTLVSEKNRRVRGEKTNFL